MNCCESKSTLRPRTSSAGATDLAVGGRTEHRRNSEAPRERLAELDDGERRDRERKDNADLRTPERDRSERLVQGWNEHRSTNDAERKRDTSCEIGIPGCPPGVLER